MSKRAFTTNLLGRPVRLDGHYGDVPKQSSLGRAMAQGDGEIVAVHLDKASELWVHAIWPDGVSLKLRLSECVVGKPVA